MSTTLLQLEFNKFLEDSSDLLDRAKGGLKEYHTLIEYDQWRQMEKEEFNGLLMDFVMNYDGDERDLIWWAGRLRLSDEIDKSATAYILPDKKPDAHDTIARDNLDRIMNDITRKYYGFILCTCPECGNILAFRDDQPITCPCCPESQDYPIDSSECPDLFF